MNVPVSMRIVINLSTLCSFFLLLFYVNDYLKKKNSLNILFGVLSGVIFVESMDLLVGGKFEEIWLALSAIGLLFLTFKVTKGWHLADGFDLVTSTILSYGVVLLSTTMTTILIIIYAHFVQEIDNLKQLQFTWTMAVLIMGTQLLIAVFLGLIARWVFKIIKSYMFSYGLRMAVTIITGLILFMGAVIVLFDEFKRAKIPTEYAYLVLGLMLILIVFVTVGMFFYTKAMIRQNKLNLEHENQKNLSMYVEQLERNYREIRKFRHDIANAILAMETIINEHGDSALTDDFHTLLAHYNFDTIQNKAIGRFQEINNAYLKGIIFSKYIEAHNNRIPFNLEVEANLFEEKKQYFDELRLLGIFLDNAIEAVHQQETGEITVSLFKQAQKTVYRIKNTFQEPVAFGKIYQSGYSTKGPDRGIGLATAKEITDARDDFRLVLKQEDDCFVAMLVVEQQETND